MDERLHSHYQSLTRAIDFTKGADAKAAPVVILHVALIGALAFRAAPLFEKLSQCPWGFWEAALFVVMALYIISALGAIGVAGWVFLPRTQGEGKSLIYFEDIASMCQVCFQSKSKKLDVDLIEDRLLQQIFAVSKIASQKMRWVKCALILSGGAIALWVILLGWGIVVGSAPQ